MSEETNDLGDLITEEKPISIEPSGISLDGKPKKVKKKPHYPRPTHKVDIYMNPVRKMVGQKCIFANSGHGFPGFCVWSTKHKRCKIRRDMEKPIVLTKENKCPYQRIRIAKRVIKAV